MSYYNYVMVGGFFASSSDMMYGGRNMAFDDEQKQLKKGIYRKGTETTNPKTGKPMMKFKYFYMDTDKPVDEETQKRIDKLGLAPAYKDVWVSIDPDSKIQATGIDDRGRKQYRYNPNHVQDASKQKFVRLYKFVKAMPKLDGAIEEDSKKPIASKEHVLALMLKIVAELNMRVGKEYYARENNSYGLTSLEKRHVKIDTTKDGKRAIFNFKAKSNKPVQYTLTVPELVEDLEVLLKLEGDKLFQYVKPEGGLYKATDTDLNAYLQEKMGKEFTVKDFRTYAANFYFVKALLKETRTRTPDSQKAIKKNLSNAQETTAFYLRHTKAISKKSYTMDLIREMYNTNPQYFIENKSKQPLTVLMAILKDYKDKNATLKRMIVD